MLIGGSRARGISLQDAGARQAEIRQRPDGRSQDQRAMIDYPSELGGRFPTLRIVQRGMSLKER